MSKFNQRLTDQYFLTLVFTALDFKRAYQIVFSFLNKDKRLYSSLIFGDDNQEMLQCVGTEFYRQTYKEKHNMGKYVHAPNLLDPPILASSCP